MTTASRNVFPVGAIVNLFQLLREADVIPAADTVLDEPLAGFLHLLVFFLRLQKPPGIADRALYSHPR
jgi:hypothetical protein